VGEERPDDFLVKDAVQNAVRGGPIV